MNNKTRRRNFIRQLTAITSLSVLGTRKAAALDIDFVKTQSFGFLCEPYLQNLTPCSVNIRFITSEPAYSWIEYGKERPAIKAEKIEDGLVDSNIRINDICIENLRPNTRYKYVVFSKPIIKFDPYDLQYGDTIQTQEFSFKTPGENADSVSCVILNDIHDRPNSFKTLLTLPPIDPYEFVFLNGDMFDYQVDEEQIIEHLVDPCTSVFASEIPFIMSRGNHETRGAYRRELKQYFSYPQNRYYFSFNQGPVYWIVLDTGEDKPDDHPVYGGVVDFDSYRNEQAEWLKGIVASEEYKAAPFRVVLMHIPMFKSDDWHGTLHCRMLFSPIFEEHNVDMVVSGHTHRYGVYPPDQEHPYPLIIGGGPKEGTRTVIQLKASMERLTVEMFRDDAQRVGQFSISGKSI